MTEDFTALYVTWAVLMVGVAVAFIVLLWRP